MAETVEYSAQKDNVRSPLSYHVDYDTMKKKQALQHPRRHRTILGRTLDAALRSHCCFISAQSVIMLELVLAWNFVVLTLLLLYQTPENGGQNSKIDGVNNKSEDSNNGVTLQSDETTSRCTSKFSVRPVVYAYALVVFLVLKTVLILADMALGIYNRFRFACNKTAIGIFLAGQVFMELLLAILLAFLLFRSNVCSLSDKDGQEGSLGEWLLHREGAWNQIWLWFSCFMLGAVGLKICVVCRHLWNFSVHPWKILLIFLFANGCISASLALKITFLVETYDR